MRCLVLVAVGVLPVLGGEKATISAPTKPSAAANPALTRPPNTSFQPIDNNSSIGGVVDSAAVPTTPSVNVPDARTQKELIERLDRKKNWLLDDSPTRPGSANGALNLDPAAEIDYSTNPRRPQTALERRLKNGSRTTATEAVEQNARQRAYFDEQGVVGDRNFGLDAFSRPTTGSALMPAWSGTTALGNGFQAQPSSEKGTLDSVRTSVSGNLGRASGLDSMTQERSERYQRTFGLEDAPERTSSLGATVDQSRTRELRSEIMGQLLGAGSDPRTQQASALGRDEAPGVSSIARASLDPSAAAGAPANSYPPLSAPPEPYVSPAAKMMRAAPAEIPRFRP